MFVCHRIISVVTIYTCVQWVYSDTVQPIPPADTKDTNFEPISSRNYGNTADASNNYYSTYPGYQTYGSSSSYSDPYNPPDYTTYYVGAQDTKKKPSQPTYPSYPSLYPSAGPYGSPECQDQMMNGVIGDILQTSGVGNYGLLKSVVAAITAGLLAKIPIILAIKALIVKVILVPLGLLVLSLPFILPIVLLFSPLWTKLKETFTGTTTSAPPTMVVMMPANVTNATTPARARELNYSRDIFMAILESERCFEKLACLLGSKDANSPYIKPVSWLLKFLQTFRFVQHNLEIKSTLKRYREAYMQGVTLGRMQSTVNATEMADVCSDKMYPCNTPVLFSRPEFTSFSRFL